MHTCVRTVPQPGARWDIPQGGEHTGELCKPTSLLTDGNIVKTTCKS